jgi:tetratricopeptide (TPR) repeat protein
MSLSLSQGQIATPEAPWLGLRSFTEEAHDYFFGRRAELEDLYERVLDKPLTILFGPSGLGKSSLLQAALIPRLRAQGFLPVLVRFDHELEAPPLEKQMLENLREALTSGGFETQMGKLSAALGEEGAGIKWDAAALLWLIFHDPSYGFLPLRGESTDPLPRPVFLIDQFEEIFTLGERPSRRAVSLTFREALSALVENRPPASLRVQLEKDDALVERIVYQAQHAHVLLSLREDFLHLLERWRRSMPSLMENRFELRMLSGPQAFDAVVRPGQLRSGAPPIIPDEVGQAIVRFVAGAEDDVPLAEIDAVPPLLSLVCAELNAQRIAAGEQQITRSQFEGHSDEILQSFYLRSFDLASYGGTLDYIPDAAVALQALKGLIEDRLLSPDGYRESIAFDTIARDLVRAVSPETAKVVLEEIIERRLLTVDERGGVRRLELAHDVLAPIVRDSRDERQEADALAHAKREKERAETETKRVQIERNRLRRFVIIAGTSAILAIAAAITSVLFFLQAKESRNKLSASLDMVERQRAEQSALRSRADSVMSFIMNDVTRVFREQGQLKLLRSIADQVETYNDATRQKTDDSGSRLLAAKVLSERATAAESIGQVEEAMQLMREQVALLRNESPAQIESRLQLFNALRWLANTIFSVSGHQEPWTDAAPLIEEARKVADDLNARAPQKLEVIGAQARILALAARYARSESVTATSQADEATALLGGAGPQEAAKIEGLRQLAQSKDREASDLFRQVLTLVRAQSKTALANPDFAEASSVVIWNYGKYLQQKGDYPQAISLFEEDMRENGSIIQRDPGSQKARLYLAMDLREIGQTYAYESGTLSKAIDYYRRVLTVCDEMVVMVPRGANGWWEKRTAHQKLAGAFSDLLSRNKDESSERDRWLEEMWKHGQEEVVASRRLVEIEPQSPRWRSLLFDSLDDYTWRATTYLDSVRQGTDKAKALTAARMAFTTANELWENHRGEIKTRSARTNLSGVYLAIGQCLAFAGDLKEARRSYETVFPVTALLPNWKPCLFEDNRGPAALGIALLCEQEKIPDEVLKWLEEAIRYDPCDKAFLKLAEIYESGTGVPKDSTKAKAYRKQAERRSVKTFSIPMPVGPTEKVRVQLYVGREFADGRTPLDECNRQLEYLREKGVYLPPDVNESLKKLWDIAVENKVEFVDMLTYALNYAKDEKKTSTPEERYQIASEALKEAELTYAAAATDANKNALIRAYNSAADSGLYVQRWAEVEKWSRKSLGLSSANGNAHANLATALLFQGKYSEALRIFREHWNESLGDGTLAHAAYEDFDQLSKAGITHPDIARLKAALPSPTSKPKSTATPGGDEN